MDRATISTIKCIMEVENTVVGIVQQNICDTQQKRCSTVISEELKKVEFEKL